MDKEKEFQVLPQHQASLEHNIRAVGRILQEGERKAVTDATLTGDELTALHKAQADAAGTFQWLKNLRQKYFAGRIQPLTNGTKIIDMP